MFVRSQRNIKDWASSKSALLEEFGIKLSSAEVHRRLGKLVSFIFVSHEERLSCEREMFQMRSARTPRSAVLSKSTGQNRESNQCRSGR